MATALGRTTTCLVALAALCACSSTDAAQTDLSSPSSNPNAFAVVYSTGGPVTTTGTVDASGTYSALPTCTGSGVLEYTLAVDGETTTETLDCPGNGTAHDHALTKGQHVTLTVQVRSGRADAQVQLLRS